MALDTLSVANSIIDILKANTSTLASSLTSSSEINTINLGDFRSLPITIDAYPAVLVKLVSEDEEFAQIGQRNNKHILQFDLASLVYQSDSAIESDKDCFTLTKNLKSVLKTNITLSNTALLSLPERVEYHPLEIDGVYCSGSLMTFRAEFLST